MDDCIENDSRPPLSIFFCSNRFQLEKSNATNTQNLTLTPL